jgi:hypothetical protein
MNVQTWKNRVKALTNQLAKDKEEYMLLSNSYENVRDMVRDGKEMENVDKHFHNVFEKLQNIKYVRGGSKKTKQTRNKTRRHPNRK